jgi:hypothetical protein
MPMSLNLSYELYFIDGGDIVSTDAIPRSGEKIRVCVRIQMGVEVNRQDGSKRCAVCDGWSWLRLWVRGRRVYVQLNGVIRRS